MVRTTWDELTADLRDDDVERLEAFRAFCTSLPEVAEEVHRTELRYRVRRVFAVGFLLAHRLELAVDLPERVDHPRVVDAFPTTKRVVTHRLSLPHLDDFDDSVRALLVRAHDEVGPGFRPQR
ncbi:MAG TPA: hypothetical protein VLQ78_12360 [Ornithinibacter sp.]|nr:hypothetical protein [Ornithinibacter sp.]